MHAIIETGGKQYKVAEGDVLFIEKLPQQAGDEVKFDKVLAVLGDEELLGKVLDNLVSNAVRYAKTAVTVAVAAERGCVQISVLDDGAGIAGEVEDPTKRRVLAQFLYHLGRWIYLVDALDDLKKDAGEGQYNPILLRYDLAGGELTPEARRDVVITLDASIRQMAAAFELWDFGRWSGVIRAAVYEGLYRVGNGVLEGTFHASPRRRQRRGKKEHI